MGLVSLPCPRAGQAFIVLSLLLADRHLFFSDKLGPIH